MFLASMDVLLATHQLTVWPVLNLSYSKLTPVSIDVDLDSIKMVSYVPHAQVDVLAVLDPTSVSSADQADLPTMVSATIPALLGQSPPTPHSPVLIAMLLVLPVLNILPNVLHVHHAVDHSSTSNVLLLAPSEPTLSMVLANIVLIAVPLVLDPIPPVLAAQLAKSFSMVLAMINAPMS